MRYTVLQAAVKRVVKPVVKVAIFTELSLGKEDFPGVAGIIYKLIGLKRLVADVREALSV
ncbi:MAG: hypothetical protein HOL51_05895 [Gemmatimonadetes bacterium]|jgi:hypothetical protein|nr:hypothetical protein [Gemmatimonadota bacterium]MBT5448002.1 hypothetical protein [Gemmatimonadota bacterium]MBT5802731.1 hypothetical protein [Gemmatimonadota bacterium]MBT6619702.1 hypothetical protein [Gemmatimonadota bacterium]MBT6907331.1 hypothetical protein [Gemmatimonadota bacterium]